MTNNQQREAVASLIRECDVASEDLRKWVRVPVKTLRAALAPVQPLTVTAEQVEAALDLPRGGADYFTYVQEWWAVRDRILAALGIEVQP